MQTIVEGELPAETLFFAAVAQGWGALPLVDAHEKPAWWWPSGVFNSY